MTIPKRIEHLEREHATLDKKIDGLESTGAFQRSEERRVGKEC